MSFANKVVIVTGASSGIGAATVKLFSQEGANVVLVGRNETKLNLAAPECNDPLVITADIANEEDARNVIEECINTFGKLDILVNNAGILRYASIFDENILEVFDEQSNTNLPAMLYMTHLAAPYLIKTKGNIVNISSIIGKKVAATKLATYGITKAGVNNLTKGTALELAEYGVRVNSISPGPVRTDFLINAGDETPWKCFDAGAPLGKVVEPEDIGNLVLFLASDKACSVTGSDYVIDNGVLLK